MGIARDVVSGTITSILIFFLTIVILIIIIVVLVKTGAIKEFFKWIIKGIIGV